VFGRRVSAWTKPVSGQLEDGAGLDSAICVPHAFATRTSRRTLPSNDQWSSVLQTLSGDLQVFWMGGTGLEPVTPQLVETEQGSPLFAEVRTERLVDWNQPASEHLSERERTSTVAIVAM
jgi:hypothetical protein